jgi:hypothetical protein
MGTDAGRDDLVAPMAERPDQSVAGAPEDGSDGGTGCEGRRLLAGNFVAVTVGEGSEEKLGEGVLRNRGARRQRQRERQTHFPIE